MGNMEDDTWEVYVVHISSAHMGKNVATWMHLALWAGNQVVSWWSAIQPSKHGGEDKFGWKQRVLQILDLEEILDGCLSND